MPVGGGKLLMIVLAGCSTPLLTGATDGFDSRLVSRHNLERESLGIPPLRWDPTLAVSASGWANHLAATNTFQHAPENAAALKARICGKVPRGVFHRRLWLMLGRENVVIFGRGAFRKIARPGVLPTSVIIPS